MKPAARRPSNQTHFGAVILNQRKSNSPFVVFWKTNSNARMMSTAAMMLPGVRKRVYVRSRFGGVMVSATSASLPTCTARRMLPE